MRNEISRREVLGIAGAAGGLALTGGLRSAWAQGATKIEAARTYERTFCQSRV